MTSIAEKLYVAADGGDVDEVRRILALPGTDSNAPGPNGRSPLQAAAKSGHVEVVERLLARPEIDVNGTPEEGIEKKTPLHMAAEHGHPNVVKRLLTHPNIQGNSQLVVSGLTPLHLAAWKNHPDVVMELLEWPDINVNFEDRIAKRTPLHFAVEKGNTQIVHLLTKDPRVRASLEDVNGRTALQLAWDSRRQDIERLLIERSDVKDYLDRLYRDREVYVEAANAILVGASVIASVTFAGWLQPPQGFTTYYGSQYALPYPAPPGTYESFAAMQYDHVLRGFWICNSLSFFFAIGTVIAGAGTVLPQDNFIGEAVKEVREALIMTSTLLVISVIFVLGAFGTAGYAALPPVEKYDRIMLITIGIGGSTCSVLLLWFVVRIYHLRPRWWRAMEAYMMPGDHSAPPLEQSLSQQYRKGVQKNLRRRRKEFHENLRSSC